MNLHEGNEPHELMKAALTNGKPLYGFVKGDVDGHPFRGNQHTDGEGGGNPKTKEQSDKLKADGFKYDKTTQGINTVDHIFKHPDGSIATVTERKDPVTERVKVTSYVNTTNKGKTKSDAPGDLSKGDVAGHEFHGNQYTDGGEAAGRANDLTSQARQASASAREIKAHQAAAHLHTQAMEAHKAARDQSLRPRPHEFHAAQVAQHASAARSHLAQQGSVASRIASALQATSAERDRKTSGAPRSNMSQMRG